MVGSCVGGCHGAFAPADSKHFDTQGEAYTFALARSSNNNANSLFLRKPQGFDSHGGGTVWTTGSAPYNTALAWINSGRNP
jgi:hypothetical protein